MKKIVQQQAVVEQMQVESGATDSSEVVAIVPSLSQVQKQSLPKKSKTAAKKIKKKSKNKVKKMISQEVDQRHRKKLQLKKAQRQQTNSASVFTEKALPKKKETKQKKTALMLKQDEIPLMNQAAETVKHPQHSRTIKNQRIKLPRYRQAALIEQRNLKMARSIHAYVRGNTAKYYEWLNSIEINSIPQGPAVWICGDCHTGNLGPVTNAEGKIEIQIRDLDQTVIGNPANDLIRLGLSLATVVRSSDLPGVVSTQMIEALYQGYVDAIATRGEQLSNLVQPKLIAHVMSTAIKRTWKNLAQERLNGLTPKIELGRKFWPLLKVELQDIEHLFQTSEMCDLVSMLSHRKDDIQLKVLDAAYWVKGCSSLGRLRYVVLLDSTQHVVLGGNGLCLMDLKEGTTALAPRYADVTMPKDNAKRVVEGAKYLAPYLGERMRAIRFQSKSVIVRELLPQDLKLDIENVKAEDAQELAFYLAYVVGKAHVRQMSEVMRITWLRQLKRQCSRTMDAPHWLWRSIVELIATHEAGYLEHCRRYALTYVKKA